MRVIRSFAGAMCGLVCLGFAGAAAAAEAASQEPTSPPAAAASLAVADEGSTDALSGSEASEVPAKNAVFLEGLGPGLLYSINYERLVLDEMAVRLGFSYWSVTASASSGQTTATASASFWTVPVTVAYVGLRGLEAGGGLTLVHASGSGSTVGASASGAGFAPLATANVGYRLHPVSGAGFQFRIGALAMIGQGLSLSASSPDSIGVLPWVYLSLGAGFGA
jgi:hypothetical protein